LIPRSIFTSLNDYADMAAFKCMFQIGCS